MPQLGDTARTHHWQMLIIACGVIVAAGLLRVSDDGRVVLPGPIPAALPPACFSRAVLGMPCPGCGLTRSFVHLAHGHWAKSLQAHRVGWILALATVVQVPYRLGRLASPQRYQFPAWVQKVFGSALIAVLIGNWIAGRICGY